jgi:hypothetical protein
MKFLKANGKFTQKVHGVSFDDRQLTLYGIAGPRSRDGYDCNIIAALLFENDNKFDKFAIAVFCFCPLSDSYVKIGYISQKRTQKYRERLTLQGLLDGEPVFCHAKIVGGVIYDSVRKEGDIFFGPIGVRLDMKYPLEILLDV